MTDTQLMPVLVRFGRGVRRALAETCGTGRWCVVSSAAGRARVMRDPVLADVIRARDPLWIDGVGAMTDLRALERLSERSRGEVVDVVVGIGGGAVLDAAKIVAATCALPAISLAALIERPGSLLERRLPRIVLLPTTAGSGSEVTPFATVWDLDRMRKCSLASTALWPYAALVDPDLGVGAPRAIVRAAGLDALNQAFEATWNRNATPLTQAWAARAAALAWEALPHAVHDPGDWVARERMAEAALLAGLAISHTRTALCHSMSYPLTLRFGIPHGVACAFTMAAVARHVLPADDGRMQELACLVLGSDRDVSTLPDAIESLMVGLGVRHEVRSSIGGFDRLLDVVNEMDGSGRAVNSLVPADERVRVNLLREAWGC